MAHIKKENLKKKTSQQTKDSQDLFPLKMQQVRGSQPLLDGDVDISSSDSEEFACNPRDPGLIPRLGRSPGEGNGYTLQCSCLEKSMDRGAWQATIHGIPKSWTRLSD